MNGKHWVVALAALTLLGVASAVEADSITYYLVDYPEDQNGWTLEGFITTNGKTGALEEDDILAWSWTAIRDGLSYAYASEDPEAEVVLTGNILADVITIRIAAPFNPNPGAFHTEDNNLTLRAASDYPLIHWRTFMIDPAAGMGIVTVPPTGHYEARDSWGAIVWNTWRSEMGGNDRVIAEVPEPRAGAMVGTLVLGGTLLAPKRRRRRFP